MSTFQSAVLGIVQGLTEFLPISSSAHLFLVPWLLRWSEPGLAFDVALHWGTLLAVVIYYRKDVTALISGFFASLTGTRSFEARLPWFIIVATIPGVIAGFAFEDVVETSLRSPWII